MIDFESGFCGSVLGTKFYKDAVSAKKSVYENSECHTLDRDDFRAQKDSCGIGEEDEQWELAIQRQFNVTNWPYIQDIGVYSCV